MEFKKGTKVILSESYKSSAYYEPIQEYAGKICTIASYNKEYGEFELEELPDYGPWTLDDFSEIITSDQEFVKEVPMKRLRPEAIVPQYAHGYEDSGMDVFACKIAVKVDGEWEENTKYKLAPNETVLVKIGWAFAVPTHYELQARPTSGNSLKTMLRVANSPGTIDAGYRGEVGIIITNTGDEYVSIHQGDKVAQLVLCPVYHADLKLVDELPEANRGKDGYGSTGTIKDVK